MMENKIEKNRDLEIKKLHTIMMVKGVLFLLSIFTSLILIAITFTFFQIMSVLMTIGVVGGIILTIKNTPGW